MVLAAEGVAGAALGRVVTTAMRFGLERAVETVFKADRDVRSVRCTMSVGTAVGATDGTGLGATDGVAVGMAVRAVVGNVVGCSVGRVAGTADGRADGTGLGSFAAAGVGVAIPGGENIVAISSLMCPMPSSGLMISPAGGENMLAVSAWMCAIPSSGFVGAPSSRHETCHRTLSDTDRPGELMRSWLAKSCKVVH